MEKITITFVVKKEADWERYFFESKEDFQKELKRLRLTQGEYRKIMES